MTCWAWLEGTCDCGQPCNERSEEISLPPPICAPAISTVSEIDAIRAEFKKLAEVYSSDHATHIVWQHFELVGKLIGVDVND